MNTVSFRFEVGEFECASISDGASMRVAGPSVLQTLDQ